MKLNKDDIYGIVGSVAFHLFILLILGFTVLKTVVPDEDGGILVNFGNVNAAAGTFEPKYTGQEPPQETTTPPPPVPEPKVETPKEDLVTQEIEESVAIEGVGGYGSFNLNGRSIGAGGLPRPAYTIQEEGRIVINITVDPKGNVIFAEIGKGTNIDNGSMRKSALDAAKRAKFNSISGANNQSGTITYLYKLK